MERIKLAGLVLLTLITGLVACGLIIGLWFLDLEDLPVARPSSRPTATLLLARFSTVAATPVLTGTPAVEPTSLPTTAPEVTATLTVTVTGVTSTATAEARATEDEGDDETTFESPLPTPTPTAEPPTMTPTPTVPPPPPTATPTETPSPTPAPLAGRIAFPVDDGGGHYDVWVVELPDGEPFFVQKRARQPNFSVDGQLLVNFHDNDQFENHIGLLDVNYAWLGLVSDSPHDAYPFWNPDGSRYVFSNPQLLLDPNTGDPLPHVFIPCSMRRPWEEGEIKCQDIKTWGKVAIGEFPVWTEDDRIAFFTFTGDDGIYVVSGASTLWQAGGVGSPQLLIQSNGRPSDTYGFQVFFSAGNLDQNWEAYSIDLDGTNLINLSNSPISQDGLPTVSPDGNWVAFVSDRDGLWGIWVVPRTGGEPTKIVDFSKINTNPSPWGTGDREWTLERISWGP